MPCASFQLALAARCRCRGNIFGSKPFSTDAGASGPVDALFPAEFLQDEALLGSTSHRSFAAAQSIFWKSKRLNPLMLLGNCSRAACHAGGTCAFSPAERFPLASVSRMVALLLDHTIKSRSEERHVGKERRSRWSPHH